MEPPAMTCVALIGEKKDHPLCLQPGHFAILKPRTIILLLLCYYRGSGRKETRIMSLNFMPCQYYLFYNLWSVNLKLMVKFLSFFCKSLNS